MGQPYWSWMREAVRALKPLTEKHGFGLFGTIPHALNAVLGGSVAAAKAFHEVYPEIPLTVLTDYEGREMDVIREAVAVFGEKLYAVRLDTHGGRIHQGGVGVVDLWKKPSCSKVSGLRESFGKYGEPAPQFMYGVGVTLEAYLDARKLLDDLDAQHVKIVLSSGFGEKKIRAFRKWIDPERTIIGTGSWVGAMNFHPTMDMVEINPGPKRDGIWRPCLKEGREYIPNERLKEVDVA